MVTYILIAVIFMIMAFCQVMRVKAEKNYEFNRVVFFDFITVIWGVNQLWLTFFTVPSELFDTRFWLDCAINALAIFMSYMAMKSMTQKLKHNLKPYPDMKQCETYEDVVKREG